MYRCGTCRHSFTLITDEKRVRYTDDYYEEKHANWFNNPNYRLFDFVYSTVIRPIKKRDIRLIDVGCGKGDFLKHIQRRDPGLQLYGFDLSGNSYPGITFIKGDFLKDPCQMKFDVICSFAAIEHVDDIGLFVEKLKKMLLPGGVVVITTDNTGGLFYAFARLMKRVGVATPYYSLYELAHLQHFTNRSLKALMERSGFEVVAHRNHNYPVKAIDMPRMHPAISAAYILGAKTVFFLTNRSFGILQTIVCRTKAQS
jgi:2-polyprenyl-3-methyl-5-hydroxy-6-metoxy-1,4-benzoquinol methylase